MEATLAPVNVGSWNFNFNIFIYFLTEIENSAYQFDKFRITCLMYKNVKIKIMKLQFFLFSVGVKLAFTYGKNIE